MDAPTCRICNEKHWSHEPHKFKGGQVISVKIPRTKRGGEGVTLTSTAHPEPRGARKGGARVPVVDRAVARKGDKGVAALHVRSRPKAGDKGDEVRVLARRVRVARGDGKAAPRRRKDPKRAQRGKGKAKTAPKKQRWDREAYNEYMRKLMRRIRRERKADAPARSAGR